MPKVSDAYRESRRDEIAQAAMRRLSVNGFANTSMADISAESGLSAGAIYSHFASKAEIARYVARMVLERRAAELTAHAETVGRPLAPAEVIAFMVSAIQRSGVSTALLLQVWAESTVDPELREMVTDTVGQLRAAYSALVRDWLVAQGRPADDADIRRAATTMLTLSQGYITNAAMFGGDDPEIFLATAAELLN